MADPPVEYKSRSQKTLENNSSISCFYCKSSVTTKVQCKKCLEVYHPSCFKRAQEKKAHPAVTKNSQCSQKINKLAMGLPTKKNFT